MGDAGEGKQHRVIFRWGLGWFWGELAGVNPLAEIIRGTVVDEKSRPLSISAARVLSQTVAKIGCLENRIRIEREYTILPPNILPAAYLCLGIWRGAHVPAKAKSSGRKQGCLIYSCRTE